MGQLMKMHSAPAPLVAMVAWLIPGGGYFLIGQRGRALTVGITVVILFIFGLLIGGMRVAEMPASPLSSPYNAVMQRPWFVGQILAGPIELIAAWIGKGEGFLTSHARVSEIGTLYTAVAGMLNLLAIIDATYRAGRSGGQA
jgi:hypothetical protein